MQEKIIEKIDSYNIITSIIPGYVLLIFNFYYFNIPEINAVNKFFIAYIVGQILNRIGSVVVGPILLKFTKEKGEPYDKYIKASENDKKISILLSEKNSYRTFCTLFAVCIIEILINKIMNIFNISIQAVFVPVLVFLIIIYAISYCKHNRYISSRIKAYFKNNE